MQQIELRNSGLSLLMLFREKSMRHYFGKIYKDGFTSFMKEVEGKMIRNEKTFIITANPETLMIGEETPEFDAILKSSDTIIVPDGIGVVKAANLLGYCVKERVTGVEIVQRLLELLNKQEKSLYLLGAKEDVLKQFVAKIGRDYPSITLAGYQNGYIKDKDACFNEIAELQPDAVLVALGIPAQEMLIAKHYERFEKGVFIGVGGSFDVLSGAKKRAPKIFIKLNLEWLYRIAKEPNRIKRFYRSNVKFIAKVKVLRDQNEN